MTVSHHTANKDGVLPVRQADTDPPHALTAIRILCGELGSIRSTTGLVW